MASQNNKSRTVAPAISIAKVFKKGFHSYTPEQIKLIIEKLCMTHGEFADLLFVEKSTVAKWLSGKRLPSTPAMRLMSFVEVLANEKHHDVNHRIRKAYK